MDIDLSNCFWWRKRIILNINHSYLFYFGNKPDNNYDSIDLLTKETSKFKNFRELGIKILVDPHLLRFVDHLNILLNKIIFLCDLFYNDLSFRILYKSIDKKTIFVFNLNVRQTYFNLYKNNLIGLIKSIIKYMHSYDVNKKIEICFRSYSYSDLNYNHDILHVQQSCYLDKYNYYDNSSIQIKNNIVNFNYRYLNTIIYDYFDKNNIPYYTLINVAKSIHMLKYYYVTIKNDTNSQIYADKISKNMNIFNGYDLFDVSGNAHFYIISNIQSNIAFVLSKLQQIKQYKLYFIDYLIIKLKNLFDIIYLMDKKLYLPIELILLILIYI